MSTDSTLSEVVPIEAPLIDSLMELRRQNSALLQREVAGQGTPKPSPGELLGFLISAKKLGRNLEDDDSRETAQGIMDFWIASLLSQAPQAAEGTRPFTLEAYDEKSARLLASEARQLSVDAVKVVKRAEDNLSSPPDRVSKEFGMSVLSSGNRKAGSPVLEGLLLRFVRLKEQSTEAYSVPIVESDIFLSVPEARVQLDRLIAEGIVTKRDPAQGTEVSYTLTHESLLTKWAMLIDILNRRRSFRQLAQGWHKGGRQPSALISGGRQLQEALDYPHTDEIEDAFIEASRRSGEKFRRIALTLASVTLIVMSVLVWLLIQQNRKLELAIEKRDIATKDLKIAKAEAVQEAAISGISKSQLYSLRDLLLDRNQQYIVNPQNPKGNGIAKVVWREVEITPDLKKSVASVLQLIDIDSYDSKRPHLEVFIPLACTPASKERANALVALLSAKQDEKDSSFQLLSYEPLPRKSKPGKTEIRYYYVGDGPDFKVSNEAKKIVDPDRKLAQEVLARLIKAGIPTERIEIIGKADDDSAPENFIQLAFDSTVLP